MDCDFDINTDIAIIIKYYLCIKIRAFVSIKLEIKQTSTNHHKYQQILITEDYLNNELYYLIDNHKKLFCKKN